MKHNLIYFLFPRRGSNWQEPVAELLPNIHKFNGRKIITVAEDHNTDDLSVVIEAFQAFGRAEVEFIPVVNDARLGEMPHFLNTMDLLADDQDGATLYMHAKGVSYKADGRYIEAIGGPGSPERESNIRNWRQRMLDYLTNITAVQRALDSGYDAVGCFKVPGIIRKNAPVHWHYSGTFFWFRNSTVFQHPEWREIYPVRSGTEFYLQRIIPSEAAACLYADFKKDAPLPSPPPWRQDFCNSKDIKYADFAWWWDVYHWTEDDWKNWDRLYEYCSPR
jgi:hypothetical protein